MSGCDAPEAIELEGLSGVSASTGNQVVADADADPTTYTSGSILFAESDGSISQDNTNLFYDKTTLRVGILTNTPTATLDINGKFNVAGSDGTATWADAGGDSTIGLESADLQIFTPSTLILKTTLGTISAQAANIDFKSTGTQTFIMRVDTDNDSGTRDGVFKIHNDGSVTASWAWGLDGSDGDSFVISRATNNLGTNNALKIDSSGNITIPGTLGVTGLITASAGMTTAGGSVTLGAGDDLIGSSTSDITINTDKFTVAGATGNIVVAGTSNLKGVTTLASGSTIDDDGGGDLTITAQDAFKFVSTGNTCDIVSKQVQMAPTDTGGVNLIMKSDPGNVSAVSDCVIAMKTDGSGTATWAFGMDDSDGDAFVISRASSSLGTNNAFKIDGSGDSTITGTLGVTGGILKSTYKTGGVVTTLSTNYISGTGTAGADNTAQTVKTIVLAANSLTQNGDRIRIRCYWTGDSGAPITGAITVNGVSIGTATDAGAATFQVTESWLHYIDSTHANIISMENGVIETTLSAANVAGFDFTTAQDIDLDQDAIASNHIVVYFFAADIFPKGSAT